MTASLRGNGARRKLTSVGGAAIWPVLCASALSAAAQLTVLPDSQPKQMFPGKQTLSVRLNNQGPDTVNIAAHIRLVQTSSGSAAPFSEIPWKQIQVLPGQTIVESATVDFPVVNAETRFLVQWLEGTNTLVGKTEVQVYPTNLLAELKPLAGESLPGIYDPENRIKPLLRQLAVEFTSLEDIGFDDFSGRLAVIGPFRSKAQMRERLAGGIAPLTKKNIGVVWIQPPTEHGDKLRPSFYSVPVHHATVVVVRPELLADLAGNPQSQLNLIHFCKLALLPEPPRLPPLTIEP